MTVSPRPGGTRRPDTRSPMQVCRWGNRSPASPVTARALLEEHFRVEAGAPLFHNRRGRSSRVRDADVDRYIRRHNVEITSVVLRAWRMNLNGKTILTLLAEERQKQKDAGDFVTDPPSCRATMRLVRTIPR